MLCRWRVPCLPLTVLSVMFFCEALAEYMDVFLALF